MSSRLSAVSLVLLISSSSFTFTEHHGIEPKMFSTRWHDFNNCEIPITNYGEFGYMYGFWPRGSGDAYIFGAGLWVGAMKNGDTPVSCGYNTVGAGNDWMPGPPEHNYDHSVDRFSHPEDRIYLSTSLTDLKEWPLRDSLGSRIILSGQDGWGEYNDLWEPNHAWEPGTYPLGLWVRQHSFCWRFPFLLENMLFILYQMENISTDTIKEMYVGIGADMDVGWADDDLLGCDIDLGIGYTYSLYYENIWFQLPPHYVGVTVVQGPRATDTVYVADGPWNPDYPYAYRDTVYPGEHLPLTSFTECTRGYDADTDAKRYLALKGYNFESRIWDPWPWTEVPDDKRMVLGCGPFELEPGEIDTFMIAVMFSNNSTGGLHYLLSEAAIARSVARAVANRPSVRVVSPNGGEELSGMQTITWETLKEEVDTIDLYLSSDSGRIWSELATNLENTGSYLWNTEYTADGFYFLKAYGRGSFLLTWDISDGEFTVNSPENGTPQVTLLAPNGGDTLSGIIEITWWARDPDGDDISIDLHYSHDGGYSSFPIAVGLPNSGSNLCSTESLPSGSDCFIKVEATDGSLTSFDCSDSCFSLFNSYESAGEVHHIAGGCNTVKLTPEIVRDWELSGHSYKVGFGPHGFDSLTNKVVYTYDIYDITSDSTVVADREFSVDLNGIAAIHCSPLFDGLSLKIETSVDSSTFHPHSVTVSSGEYFDDLEVFRWFLADPAECQFTTPECKIWAFRGNGIISMEWIKVRDTLTVEVFDPVNNRKIAPDTTIGRGWCFGGESDDLPPKLFLTEENRTRWFYVSGVRYWFNSGRSMTREGFSSIDSGDVWLICNHGDRPPLPGDVYAFDSFRQAQDSLETRFLSPSNYPNPFSPQTTIRYGIAKAGRVTLKVYNALGREVGVLVDEFQQTGTYSVVWDGRDDSGRKVSSGAYFLRLEAGYRTAMRKVCVVR